MKVCIVFVTLFFAAVNIARGQTPAIDLTPLERPEVRVYNEGGVIQGWQFTPLAPITVTHLGVWDKGGDGLQLEYPIGLFKNPFDAGAFAAATSADEELLTSGVMSAGTVNPLIAGFRYVDAPNVTLVAGATYVIAYHTPTAVEPNVDYLAFEGSFFANSHIQYWGQLYDFGPLKRPQFYSDYHTWTFGANFLFTVVPEPACGSMALTALVILTVRRRSNTRR